VKHGFLAALLLVGSAYAQSSEDEPLPGSTQAIQERAYDMSLEIAAGGGLLPVDVYTKQASVFGVAVIHFSDALAFQARGGKAFGWSSGLRQQLERDFQVLPSAFPSIDWFAGGQLLFKPFYGKSSIANRFVLNFEAYLALGASVYKYLRDFRPGIDVGGGIRLFQNRILSYRLEVLDTIILTGGISNVVSVNLMLCVNIDFFD
jgi:outer membrane beta-barrel protein